MPPEQLSMSKDTNEPARAQHMHTNDGYERIISYISLDKTMLESIGTIWNAWPKSSS